MNTQITAPTADQELLKDLSIDELDALAESISHKLRSKSSCQGSLEEKIVTSFLPFRKRCNN